MAKKIESNTRPTARKTWKRRSVSATKEEGSELLNSLHKWGEDYYGVEDYYEKPVNSIFKKNNYNDYRKKSGKA